MTTTTVQEAVSSLLSKKFLPQINSQICERCRVLFVDDEPIIRCIALVLLEKFGFSHVDEAADGATALALLDQHEYGLVICDLMMEPMDGITLFRIMRSERQKQTIPFIMLTANMDHDKVTVARKAGIKNYMLKPFSLESFHQKLQEVLLPHRGSDLRSAS